MLHNAGRPVRAQHVDSVEGLAKLLQEKTWDLMIGADSTKNVSPLDAIKQVRRLNKDIPLILQTDREGSLPVVEGMKMGAADVVTLDEDQHLLFVIAREVYNREEREKRRIAERQFNEIVRRNQQLLDSSRDAIAFVQDGMFLYVNDSFAELLNHETRDDLECMPIIDIVADKHQDAVKKFLKEFLIKGSDIEATNMKCAVITADDKEKLLNMEVLNSNYDDEPCIQLLIRSKAADSEELEAQLEEIKNKDIASGLFNKNHLIETLKKAVNEATEKKSSSALLLVDIVQFLETVQAKLGVSAVDGVIKTIASYAKSLCRDNEILFRFSEEQLVILVPRVTANKALERAEKICQALRDYIVDIEGKTLQFNYLIGVAVISETCTNGDIPIQHAQKALESARSLGEKEGSVLAKLYEPEKKKADKNDVEQMVQNALDSGRFKVLFQPILSLRGSNKEHYEVLMRMVDEEGKEVSPTEFLSTAAKIGATTKLDRWVILESIKLLSEHRSKGNNTHLIINLCRESMLDATLLPWLAVAFKAAKLPTDAIIFQLREMDINDHLNVASSFTKQITEMGCSCSISHFGCALNPFNALKNVAANYVKVDGSFTQDLQKPSDSEENSLAELVSELHQQDKVTVVPFVENANVLSKLWQSGVHYIQGYYLQEPADEMNYDFDMES